MIDASGNGTDLWTPDRIYREITSSSDNTGNNTGNSEWDAGGAERDQGIGLIGSIIQEYNPEMWARMIGS